MATAAMATNPQTLTVATYRGGRWAAQGSVGRSGGPGPVRVKLQETMIEGLTWQGELHTQQREKDRSDEATFTI